MIDIDKDVLTEVLKTALARGGDFADIFIEKKFTTGIGCEDGKIERVQSGLDVGAGIRLLYGLSSTEVRESSSKDREVYDSKITGESTAYAYTNDLSREGLLQAAKIVSQAVSESKKEINLDLRKVCPSVKFNISERPETVPMERKVEVVNTVDSAAREVDKNSIKQVIVGYGDLVQTIVLANSEGAYIEDERIRTRLVVQAVAAEGATIQTGYEAVGSLSGFELFKKFIPEEVGRKAGWRAVQMLQAKPAPAGRMPVVMAGEAGGTMVHEACGHGFEADLVQKRLSVYADKKGQQVASKEITVIDDATIADRYGSYSFDDEGVPSKKVVLIKDGILVDYMYDYLTARKEGRCSNGHGRRESYQHKPIPRMANTYIAPGKMDPDKIIREVGNGLLVKKMGGGQVNTTTGDFVFDVAEGYLIKEGEIGPMVRGATLTGNGPEVIQVVEMIGRDLGFTIGTCGKDGQGVPVSDAQPTIAIKELIVGGTKQSNGGFKLRRV